MIHNLWKELLLLGTAWLVLVVIVVWMAICQEWSDMRWLSNNSKTPSHNGDIKPDHYKILDDLLLERIPIISQGWMADLFVTSSIVITLVGCVAMAPGWRARIVLLRRVGWIMATLYLLRSITISVTTLPPSIVNCTPKVAHNREEWASIIPQMISGQVSGCTDKLFSGHTCLLFISFLIWTRYARHWIFIVYSFVHTTLGIATVLAVRLHYTVDVILAIVLTFLAHQFYYTMLELAVQKQAPTVLRASQDSKGYNQVPLCNDQDLAGRDGLEFDKRNSESIALDIFPSSGSVVAENAENRLESHWATHVLSCTHSSYNSIGPETMLVNRMPLTILPNIVAWMDGWHLR